MIHGAHPYAIPSMQQQTDFQGHDLHGAGKEHHIKHWLAKTGLAQFVLRYCYELADQ